MVRLSRPLWYTETYTPMATSTIDRDAAYLQLLHHITESMRLLVALAGEAFPDHPRIELSPRLGPIGPLRSTPASAAETAPRPSAPRRHPTPIARRRPSRKPTHAPRSAATTWVGKPRLQYQRAQEIDDAQLNTLPTSAQAIWGALSRPHTGKELTVETGYKRKMVEKAIGVLKKARYVETVDLRTKANLQA